MQTIYRVSIAGEPRWAYLSGVADAPEYERQKWENSDSFASQSEWVYSMLRAQAIGRPLILSGEYSEMLRNFKKKHLEQRKKLVEMHIATGTVLDYNDGTLKERITLNSDGSFAGADIILGKKDGIYLPEKSEFIWRLHDKYMPLIARLFDVKDPRAELEENSYFEIFSRGFAHVLRGYWDLGCREPWEYDVAFACGSAGDSHPTLFLDTKPPESTVNQYEHERLLLEQQRIEEALEKPVLIDLG